MFVCMSCGLVSPIPDAECRNRVKLNHNGVDYFVPCSVWPMGPEEYIQSLLTNKNNSYFSGTVVLPDGGRIEVTAPIPESVAREIACISVEYELAGQRKADLEDAKRKARQEESDQQSFTPRIDDSFALKSDRLGSFALGPDRQGSLAQRLRNNLIKTGDK
jgi:hypothetical protein